MRRFVFDTPRVLAFMRQFPQLSPSENWQAIGLEDEHGMLAGVAFENFNGRNVWVHLAARPDSGNWLTRAGMRVAFRYPFVQLGAAAVRAYVEESNARSVQFCKHMGFLPEATLYGAGADGGNVLIFVMRREWCRHV